MSALFLILLHIFLAPLHYDVPIQFFVLHYVFDDKISTALSQPILLIQIRWFLISREHAC